MLFEADFAVADFTSYIGRRVKCDLTFPLCLRCSRAGRECEGYDLRLSWPRENDRRRAIIGPSSREEIDVPLSKEIRLINASNWDMELHRRLVDSKSSTNFVWNSYENLKDKVEVIDKGRYPLPSASIRPLRWIPWELHAREIDLIHYCELINL